MDNASERIPMLVLLGGAEEWPGDILTLKCAVIAPFSVIPILINRKKKSINEIPDATHRIFHYFLI